MTGRIDARLRSPEAAARLGVSGRDVYRLLFAGELEGGPDADGIVYFTESSVDAHLARYGYGNASTSGPRRPD